MTHKAEFIGVSREFETEAEAQAWLLYCYRTHQEEMRLAMERTHKQLTGRQLEATD